MAIPIHRPIFVGEIIVLGLENAVMAFVARLIMSAVGELVSILWFQEFAVDKFGVLLIQDAVAMVAVIDIYE
jgi:hypothetical protein